MATEPSSSWTPVIVMVPDVKAPAFWGDIENASPFVTPEGSPVIVAAKVVAVVVADQVPEVIMVDEYQLS